VTFGDGGGTDDVGGSFSARMGDITIVNAAAVTVETNAPVTATTWTQSAGSGLFRLRAALDVNGAGGVDINSNSVTLDAAGDITSAAGAVSVNGTGGGVASIRTAGRRHHHEPGRHVCHAGNADGAGGNRHRRRRG
jgi:hypothetical protein